MASAGGDSDSTTDQTHEGRECMACRGTGSVVSNLGGNAKTVTCPWCRGTGVRIADIDAQAGWGEQAAPSGADETARAGEAGDDSDDGGDGGNAAA